MASSNSTAPSDVIISGDTVSFHSESTSPLVNETGVASVDGAADLVQGRRVHPTKAEPSHRDKGEVVRDQKDGKEAEIPAESIKVLTLQEEASAHLMHRKAPAGQNESAELFGNKDEAVVPSAGSGKAPALVNAPARAATEINKTKGNTQLVIHGKAMVTVEEPPAEELIGNLWSKLPDEVMDLVLAWLPLSAFFRMRTVCKKWNYIISSPSFLDTYSRVPFRTALFLHLIRVNGVLMAACHDPTINRWQRLPLDSIPVNAYIHGGAGGLFCCQRVVNAFLVLSVCNPLTKRWRDLPPMPNLNTATCFVKMVADARTNTYKVVRVGQLQPLPPVRNNGARIELCTEVYDSSHDAWHAVDRTPTDLRFIQGCSVCNGAVQCRTSTTRRMMAYHLAREVWTELFARNLDAILDSKLVDCDGRPYLVTRVWKGGQMESIDVWGQKPRPPGSSPADDPASVANVEWEEVDRMPPALFRQWSSSAGLFYHVGVGDFIYSTCLARGDTKLVTYSLLLREWQLIDGCPVSHINTFLGGFEFRPRLDAAV